MGLESDTRGLIKLPIDEVKLPANILFCGMTGSGKTYCFRELYKKYWKSHLKLTYVICPTAEFSRDYDDVIKNKAKYVLTDMNMAEYKIAEIRKLCEAMCRKNKNYPVMLIIDDCLGVIDFNSKAFCNLFAVSRHINLSIVLMMQNLTKFLCPTLRNNLSYIFVNKISDGNLKCLYELAGQWDDYGTMKVYLRQNLVNYQTILIDKKTIEYVEPFVFRA